MILFMSGFPKSGKSSFAELLVKNLDNKLCLHINPADYYPDNFDDLPQEEKTDIAVTAWEMSLERADKSITSLPNRALAIVDTCCSSALNMRPLLLNAKVRGHDVFVVYIDTPLEKRIERTGDKNLTNLEERYKKSFGEALPMLRKNSKEFIIVGNGSDGLSELDKYARIMCEKIRKVRSD